MASSDDSNSSHTPISGNDAQPVAGAKTASLWFFTLFNLLY